jgi:hypothetical protein
MLVDLQSGIPRALNVQRLVAARYGSRIVFVAINSLSELTT